ncbi:MAG TPA: HAD family hydrolase [Phycisphaerae bacterium]|nr:HAD family hydrolase [Phycisphaerae bacterium]
MLIIAAPAIITSFTNQGDAIRYQLVIFDMDGTLTVDALDYETLRSELGVAVRHPVLEWIAALPEREQTRAWAVLHQHEAQAAEKSTLRQDAHLALDALRKRGIKIALLSRNSRKSVETILQRHALSFDDVISRDEPPVKPHPDSIRGIARRLNISLDRTLMAGDYVFDIEVAEAAQVASVLLTSPEKPRPPFAQRATYVISSLLELDRLVEEPDSFRALLSAKQVNGECINGK